MSQTKTKSLTEAQLLDLQKLSVKDIGIFLSANEWSLEKNQKNQIKDYFSYNLDFAVEKWEQKGSIYWEGTLYVYFKEGIPNLIIYHVTNSCFQNLLRSVIPKNQGNWFKSVIVKKQKGSVMEFRDYYNETSNKRFSILVYNHSSLTGLITSEKSRIENYSRSFASGNEYFNARNYESAIIQYQSAKKYLLSGETELFANIELLIQRSNRELNQIAINDLIKDGDQLAEQKKYEDAIKQYESAREKLLPEDKAINVKINSLVQKCNRGIKQLAFEEYIESGDNFYKENQYVNALNSYNEALKIDGEDKYTIERIQCIKDILDAVEIQKKEQNYSEINQTGLGKFQESSYKAMNIMMKHTKNVGEINYTATIKFDQFGNNQSNLTYHNISDKKLKYYLSSIDLASIPPSIISFSCDSKTFFIPTKEEVNFDLSWITNEVKTTIKKQKIVSTLTGSSEQQNEIREFVNQQPYKNGIYEFNVTEKKMNSIIYEDIQLTSFRYNSGPMKFLYSMILPGLGTSKVSDGKKGKDRTVLFLLSAAISIGSKIYSNNQFNKYKQGDGTFGTEAFYEKANTANKIFLVSGGLASVIYLNDIFYVFGKGLKNNNRSRNLKIKLREGPISIVESPLKP